MSQMPFPPSNPDIKKRDNRRTLYIAIPVVTLSLALFGYGGWWIKHRILPLVPHFQNPHDSSATATVPLKKEDQIFEAIDQGDIATVQRLIEEGVSVNYRSADDLVPLPAAIISGKTEIARWLIDQGADVRVQSNTLTPVFCAALSGNVEILRLLVAKGVPVDETMDDGMTPLHVAAGGDRLRVSVREQLHSPPLDKPDSLATVREILKHKPKNLNSRNSVGENAMHYAALLGEGEALIGELAKAGVDVNSADDLGNTPLINTIKNERADSFRVLLKFGANVNHAGEEKKTALHLAVDQGNVEMVKLLLQKGAKVSAVDKEGVTPLKLAKTKGDAEILAELKKAR